MSIKLLFALLIIVALAVFVGGAQSPQHPQTNRAQLLNLKQKYQQEFSQKKHAAVNWAQSKGYPVRSEFDNGEIIEIQNLLNGRPRYYVTDNLDAAKTVSTDDVWPGGSAGLSLTGNGLYLGEWDGGGVLLSHQEFGGRVTQMDYSSSTSSHSTHVAGTMIASGVDSDAKGMAGQANLHAYEWNDDDSEMANAAANGLLVSNHSYSYITGWIYGYRGDNRWAWFGDPSISETEDYNFGFYSDQSQTWDEIAYNAPYYLIIKSAGNDRNDEGPVPGEEHWVYDNNNGWVLSTVTRQPDGGAEGFDCLPGGGATAKNIMTIGAVRDIPAGYSQPADVIMSDFSSWGPTDDGRIKPDIVANGISLYSCDDDFDSDYTRYSGTSMAAPNTAGSLILLQQHYQNTHDGILMRAATLKAIVIHSADEAGGHPGPDYSYGWGLLNTKKAAELISVDVQDTSTIQELTLNQGDSTVIFVQSDGVDPLRVTIAWTDPPGTAPAAQLNLRTPVLVNDLNLRVTALNSGTVYYPWKLSPDNPSQAAVSGNNNVDTEEQVFVESPESGNYRIVVRHAGQLQGGSQNFSIIITGATFSHECVPPYIKVGDVSGVAGDTLLVPILIEQNPDSIDAFGFKFHYCSEKLSYLGVQAGNLTTDFDYLDGKENAPGVVNIGGFDPVPIDTNSSGTLVFVKLLVNQCGEGETCVLNLTFLTDDIVGLNNCSGTFTCQPACELGDPNMDGDITPGDALCVFQTYLQGGTPPEGECNTECAVLAGDANCDNDITPGDALVIFTAYLDGLTPPLACPPEGSLAKNKSTRTVKLVSLPAEKDDELKIGVRLDESAALQVFGMDLGFSENGLEFVSATSGNATKGWQAFGSHKILSGVLRIGGFHDEITEISGEENLVELTFRVRNPQQEKFACWLYNLTGDIVGAEVETFTFEKANQREKVSESNNLRTYRLGQNYPNPFNMETVISYEIPEATQVAIKIYNVNGQVIETLVNKLQQPGSYEIVWDGKDARNRDVVSGLYFFSIETTSFKKMRKMTLIK
ncbi:MAG: S8 family serine peptidase [Calditrichaeota bacterium]|nr:S8 family serine peptidase [Calditrichota bacterium]